MQHWIPFRALLEIPVALPRGHKTPPRLVHSRGTVEGGLPRIKQINRGKVALERAFVIVGLPTHQSNRTA